MEVAWRFAGTGGMVIQLDNNLGFSTHEHFWDASWLSKYPEEDERIWFGSFYRLQVQSLTIVDSGKSYRKVFDAFFKFDLMLSSDAPDENPVTSNDVNIVNSAIASLTDTHAACDKKLDEFAVDSFFAYTLNKTSIVFDYCAIETMDTTAFSSLVMHPVQSQFGTIPNDKTNLPKPIVFELFRNLEQITMHTSRFYAFNPLSLLSILNEAALPDSFKTVRINGSSNAFVEEVKEKYAASNFQVDISPATERIISKALITVCDK